MSRPFLKRGDTGADVKILQALLQSQGYFNGAIGGNYGPKTEAAVAYFQQTHIDPTRGEPLNVDGEVGDRTWAALENPTGSVQRSNIRPKSPLAMSISSIRRQVLDEALRVYQSKVYEEPDGSNWGPRVQPFLDGEPNPWCAGAWSTIRKRVSGEYPLGFTNKPLHVLTIWNRAKSKHVAFLKEGYTPRPGDAFVMLYRNKQGKLTGSGHIGLVAVTDGKQFNTFEGNCGNRFKSGVRSIASCEGFINDFDDGQEVVLGTVRAAGGVAMDSTR